MNKNNRKEWQVVCAHSVDGTVSKSIKLTRKQAEITAAAWAGGDFGSHFTHVVIVPFYP